MALTWTRRQDGSRDNGKPVYEYDAKNGDCEYSIVWACDHGGMFGYTAYRRLPDGHSMCLKDRSGITWARTLKRCKAACEAINASAMETA